MISRESTQLKHKKAPIFSPAFARKMSGRGFTRRSSNEARDTSPTGIGHNFANIRVGSPSLNENNGEKPFQARPVAGQMAPLVQRRVEKSVSRSVHKQKSGGPKKGGARTSKCSSKDQKKTVKKATEAYNAVRPFLALADMALAQLHSAWIENKTDVLAGRKKLSGVPVCAFNSNFNISARDPGYSGRHIALRARLKQLSRAMKKPVAYACASAKDKYCTTEKDGETQAYVLNARPPIYFCPPFTNSFNLIKRQCTILHEYAHLLPGVGDKGGYATLGCALTACALNIKFSAKSKDLVHTADAIAGFVMHVGQKKDTRVKVR